MLVHLLDTSETACPEDWLNLYEYRFRSYIRGSPYPAAGIDRLLEAARGRWEVLWAGTPESICCGADEGAQGMLGAEGRGLIREPRNTQPPSLRFRALLTEGADLRVLQLHSA